MEYFIHLAVLFAIYAILALSLNLIFGYGGMMSLAHAAFFGIGAYTTAVVSKQLQWNFFAATMAGILFAMVCAFLISIVLSKFKGDYYTLASLGFNFIVFATMINWDGLTGGPLGVAAIPKPSIFGINFYDNFNFLVLTALCLLLVYLICKFIVNSSFGRVLKAIREDEKAITIFGYKVQNFKLAAFVISAGLAAIGGALFASYITYIDPTTFGSNESVYLWSMIILGGLANLRGSLLGAMLLVLLPEFLRFVGFPVEIAAQMRQVVYGLLLIIFMLYRPQGLIGEYRL